MKNSKTRGGPRGQGQRTFSILVCPVVLKVKTNQQPNAICVQYFSSSSKMRRSQLGPIYRGGVNWAQICPIQSLAWLYYPTLVWYWGSHLEEDLRKRGYILNLLNGGVQKAKCHGDMMTLLRNQ